MKLSPCECTVVCHEHMSAPEMLAALKRSAELLEAWDFFWSSAGSARAPSPEMCAEVEIQVRAAIEMAGKP